ncbi:MAG: PH domain-containing protein [Planctomycetes bacterium]|nr:PH domain-containing protein [Planctomycetota bacterium]
MANIPPPPDPIDDAEKFSDPLSPTSPTPVPASDPPVLAIGGGDGASADPANEKSVWQGRTDWRHYIGICLVSGSAIILAWTIIIYAASKTSLSGWWALIIGVLLTGLVVVIVGGWILLQILRTRYRLTDQRLFVERGIFSQTIDQSELIRVDDVRLRKKFTDRIFGLGSIELLTTDTSDRGLIIEGVANPEKIAEHIRTRMRELRSRSLFIENL